VPATLLRQILRYSADHGAGRLLLDVRDTEANLGLRLLLRQFGFRADQTSTDGDRHVLSRSLDTELPELPELPKAPGWLSVTGELVADEIDSWLRARLADLLGLPWDEVAALPDDTPLLGAGLRLASLQGVMLLHGVRLRFGVDIGALDLGLDCLESIQTLREFIAARLAAGSAAGLGAGSAAGAAGLGAGSAGGRGDLDG
jgi:hypothetical protein